ncbi:MAG: hypothetical protein JWO72_281 [Caulobacteraceae bacterium]|nr:hypothetical protein [Caulobacteraceae bacterium]
MKTDLSKLAGLALACVAIPALAQAASHAAAAKLGPRTLAGVWESPWPPDQLRQPNDPPPPVEVTTPPLKPQYLAEWRAQQKATADAIARGAPPVTDNVNCIPGGFPSMMGPVFPVEVLETPGQVTIIQEAYGQTRRIYLNEKQIAVEDAEPEFFGHSVGRWEGRTLVVNTIGLKENVRMRNAPHSGDMRVDERIEVTGPDTFEDHVTVTDPPYLTGPWSWTWSYKRKPGYKMNEFICENNREFADPKTGGQRLKLGD